MAEHILVGLSSAPSNARIIRTAVTMAKAFKGSLTALFVRTPNFDAMSEADKERLRENMDLAKKLDLDTVRQMCGDIYDDAAWLTNLVKNLLAVTKIKEGRIELKMQPHLIEEIVCEALQHINRKQDGHTITVHHENELLLAKCDARLIIQVIINLVDNAIKYTPAGSHIAITTAGDRDAVQIRVADNGRGVPDSEKEKIFEMFYTGSNPIADCRRSLGLGLSLCRTIVNAHGGCVTVSDNRPSGTVFTFTIPAGEVEVHE